MITTTAVVEATAGIFPPPRHVPPGTARRPDPLGFGSSSVVAVPPPLPLSVLTTMHKMGDAVSKSFGHHGMFNGHIRSSDVEHGLYRVVYEDGDQEDLTLGVVHDILVPSPPASDSPRPMLVSKKSSRRHDRPRTKLNSTAEVISSTLSPLSPVFVSPLVTSPTTAPATAQSSLQDTVFDTDLQCQDLVGRRFLCPSLGECVVTHWDTDLGHNRVFYKAMADDELRDEKLPVVQAWIHRDNLPVSHLPGTQLF